MTYNLKVSERSRGLCYIKPSAELLVQQGMFLAQKVDIEGAVAKFEEAVKLNSKLDIDPEAESRKLAVKALVKKAKRLAKRGKLNGAISKLAEAQQLDPNRKIPFDAWVRLCSLGNRNGHATEFRDACNKIVELQPEPGMFLVISGIAKALTNDIQGAIEDFEANIIWIDSDKAQAQYTQESLDRLKRYRQGWLDALRAGENPIKSLTHGEIVKMSQIKTRR